MDLSASKLSPVNLLATKSSLIKDGKLGKFSNVFRSQLFITSIYRLEHFSIKDFNS